MKAMMDDPTDELAPRRRAKRNAKLATFLERYINGEAEKNGFAWRITVTADDAARAVESLRVIPPQGTK